MSNWYCDNGSSGTGHAGSEVDPFSFADHISFIEAGTDPTGTIYFKGTFEGSSWLDPGHPETYTLRSWDPLVNGPARFHQPGDYSTLFVGSGSSFDGLIFSADNAYATIYGWEGYGNTDKLFTNCVFYSGHSSAAFLYPNLAAGRTITFKGCIFTTYADGVNATYPFRIRGEGSQVTVIYEDCMFLYHGSNKGVRIEYCDAQLINCYVANDNQSNFEGDAVNSTWLAPINTVFSQALITVPAWDDGVKEHWDWTTLFANVPTPPQPGVGSPSYTGYDTGLWGESRTGIGTGYFAPNVAPEITVEPTNQSVTIGATAQFTLTATGTPAVSYQWYKGATPLSDGGRISGATTDTLAISGTAQADEGSFSCVVSNGVLPNATSSTVTLAVNAIVPVASFSAVPVSGTSPLTVQFTDTSTNTPTSWAWSFGDGGTSTSQNPTHTFTGERTFTVTLTATNETGSNSVTGSVTLTGGKFEANMKKRYDKLKPGQTAGVQNNKNNPKKVHTNPRTGLVQGELGTTILG